MVMKIIEKHARILRILHWFNLPLLALMIWSGVLIYWAYDAYPGFFPEWFYEQFNVAGRLSEGLSIHFFVGWLFVLNGALYLIWFFASGHWREVLPNAKTLPLIWPTILHDMGLRKTPLPKEKFNAVQRLAYSGLIVMAIVVVLSGFAIYKPVQLSWLVKGLGGYQTARFIHFAMMILICLFSIVHVIQVLRAGWNNFRAMVAGFEIEKD